MIGASLSPCRDKGRLAQATIDLEIDFVEMPDGMRLRPAFTQIRRDLGSKMVHPASHGLIGHQDTTLSKQSSTSRKLRVNRT